MTELEPEILERARRGDRDAHAALYRAYAPMVFTVARRMLGSRAAAEDVLQDSFVEVIRKADRYRGESNVGHWIRQIAINKCLSQLRSPWMRKRVAIAADAAEDAIGEADPLAERDGPLLHSDELERALDALSRTARAVVWLHDVEGYTHEEIGRLMGRTTSFSKSQLSRAYRELRAALQSSDAALQTSDAALKTSDAAWQSRDAAVRSTDAASLSTDVASLSTDAALLSSDAALLPSDAALLPRDAALLPRDTAALSKHAVMRPTDAAMRQSAAASRSAVDEADQADEETGRCLGVLKTV